MVFFKFDLVLMPLLFISTFKFFAQEEAVIHGIQSGGNDNHLFKFNIKLIFCGYHQLTD